MKWYLALTDPHPFPHSFNILIDNQQEQDDGKIYNSNFVSEPMSENRSEDIQQAQADVVSQTLSSVSEGMLKCLKPTCQAEFLSRVNLNRHKQVHTKDLQVCMLPLHMAASLYIYELVSELLTQFTPLC